MTPEQSHTIEFLEKALEVAELNGLSELRISCGGAAPVQLSCVRMATVEDDVLFDDVELAPTEPCDHPAEHRRFDVCFRCGETVGPIEARRPA